MGLNPKDIPILIQYIDDALHLAHRNNLHCGIMVWGKFTLIDGGTVISTKTQPYFINRWGPQNTCSINNGIGGDLEVLCDELWGIEFVVVDTTKKGFENLAGKRNTERRF